MAVSEAGSIERSRINRSGLSAGKRAPAFRLARVDGAGEIGLDDYRGRRVLLVFTDTACKPCDELAPQLERLHQETPDLELVMIGRGEADAMRGKVAEHGLSFPVVLQRGWQVSRKYGMFATPMAYLVDEDGLLAASAAVGAEAILMLAAERRHTLRYELRARLAELKQELETGQVELERVEQERLQLRETMLRISGAAQVLEEVLAASAGPGDAVGNGRNGG